MPDEMELKDYGRLQKDGELRIRGHDDNRLKSRYVFVFDKVMLMCKTTRVSSSSEIIAEISKFLNAISIALD
jgi:hypothetical protein